MALILLCPYAMAVMMTRVVYSSKSSSAARIGVSIMSALIVAGSVLLHTCPPALFVAPVMALYAVLIYLAIWASVKGLIFVYYADQKDVGRKSGQDDQNRNSGESGDTETPNELVE